MKEEERSLFSEKKKDILSPVDGNKATRSQIGSCVLSAFCTLVKNCKGVEKCYIVLIFLDERRARNIHHFKKCGGLLAVWFKKARSSYAMAFLILLIGRA